MASRSSKHTPEAVWRALEFLMGIEEHAAANFTEHAQYRAYVETNRPRITECRQVLKSYAVGMQPATLDEMRDAFYAISNDARARRSPSALSAVRSYLADEWDGIGPWRR